MTRATSATSPSATSAANDPAPSSGSVPARKDSAPRPGLSRTRPATRISSQTLALKRGCRRGRAGTWAGADICRRRVPRHEPHEARPGHLPKSTRSLGQPTDFPIFAAPARAHAGCERDAAYLPLPSPHQLRVVLALVRVFETLEPTKTRPGEFYSSDFHHVARFITHSVHTGGVGERPFTRKCFGFRVLTAQPVKGAIRLLLSKRDNCRVV